MITLIVWEGLLRDLSKEIDPLDPKTTYLVALERGLSEPDARMASIFANYTGESLIYTLRCMARDPTEGETTVFSRVMALMRLSELATTPEASKSLRGEALKLAKHSLPRGMDHCLPNCWIENVRYMHADLQRPDWHKFMLNLGWLVTNGQAEATKMALYFVENNLESGKLPRAEKVLNNLTYRMGRNEVPFTHDQVLRAGELKATIDRLRAERSRKNRRR